MMLPILITPLLLLALGAATPAPTPTLDVPSAETPSDDERAQDPIEEAKRRREARRKAAEDAHERALRDDVLRDDAGNPVLPGTLPADTTPEAAQAWAAVTAATGFGKPVRSFDLSFHLIVRKDQANNELDAHLRFLHPGYVAATLESGRTHLRGPEGDYLIDGDEVIRLVGREGAEDVKQIERTTQLARNFTALVDPAKLRILDLERLDDPPAGLPTEYEPDRASGHGEESIAALGASLRWLALRSPDLELESAARSERERVRSVLIGYAPDTFDVELVVIQSDAGDEPRRAVGRAPGTLLVVLGRHTTRPGLDGEGAGVRVPRWIGIRELEPDTLRFTKRPMTELVLPPEPGRFRAALQPQDFLPPR